MMTTIVEFKDFSFRYHHMEEDIIQNASFKIEQGTTTLLYGLSGSGKSTLCYAITGLIPWSVRGLFKGNVIVSEKNTKELKPNQLAGEIGYLMQNPDSQFATLIVKDELVFAAENIQISKSVIEKRLESIIRILDLREYMDRNVMQLSSGEKQRVVLGSILMMEPSLLILDEPLSFLDFPNRLKLLNYLQKIQALYSNLTTIIAEHRIHDVYALADNFLEIKEGKITQSSLKIEDTQKYIPQSPSSFTYQDLVKHYGFLECVEKKNPETKLPIIRFENVSFNYLQDQGNSNQLSVQILSNITFDIFSGETIAIIGPNGIGKTTLLYLIAGILYPATGHIFFTQKDISTIKYGNYSRNIGLIFQNPESQLLKNTIKKEIEFGPRNFQVSMEENVFDEYANFIFPTSIQDPDFLMKLNPFNLSWGEKRRLNLVSLFAYSPSIYLFDEPFTGQDYLVRKRLLENMRSIAENSGTMVISSHDEEILPLCDRVFLFTSEGLNVFEKSKERKE